jgi:hypothetical protein
MISIFIGLICGNMNMDVRMWSLKGLALKGGTLERGTLECGTQFFTFSCYLSIF